MSRIKNSGNINTDTNTDTNSCTNYRHITYRRSRPFTGLLYDYTIRMIIRNDYFKSNTNNAEGIIIIIVFSSLLLLLSSLLSLGKELKIDIHNINVDTFRFLLNDNNNESSDNDDKIETYLDNYDYNNQDDIELDSIVIMSMINDNNSDDISIKGFYNY